MDNPKKVSRAESRSEGEKRGKSERNEISTKSGKVKGTVNMKSVYLLLHLELS